MHGYYFALLSGIAAGATIAVGKLVSSALPSLVYVLILTVFSGLMTWIWIFARKESLEKVPRDVLGSFTGHVLCSFLAIWTFWQGTKLMEAAVASFSVRIELVFILLLSWLFLRERLRPIEIIGAVIIIFGTSLMGFDLSAGFSGGAFQMESLTSNGGLLMVVCGAAFAGAEVFAKNLALRIAPASLVVWRSLGLTVFYILALVITTDGWMIPAARDLGIIAGAALLGPVLARIWFMKSLQLITLGRASLLAQIEPVVTLGVAWVLLGESGALSDSIGSVLILLGCILLHM